MYQTSNGRSCFLVALEGADRVGKATQAAMLEEALLRRKMKATVEQIPFDDKITHPEIYRMLRDGTVRRFPSLFQALQGINRRFFQAQFLPILALHHDVVILDRWNLSTRVYGSVGGVPEEETDEILRDIVEPDLTVVLDGPPWPRDDLDSLEADDDFQRRIRIAYREACQRTPTARVLVDAGRHRDVVHREILSVVLASLGNRPMRRRW